jgi:two-component system, NarL family, nitrate/nitrite response regulator NarL
MNVLLVDDDAMVRSWVRMALETSEFRVVAEAENGSEVEALLETWPVALLLVDYRLPDGTGTELVRALRLRGIDTPAVLMTANAENGFNESVRDAAAQGTVLKTGSVETLLEALRRAATGTTSFDIRHPRRDARRAALSPREREAMRLVAAGATNPQIADQLGVGRETVKTLLSRAFAKLGTTRRAEAVSEAHRQGLL